MIDRARATPRLVVFSLQGREYALPVDKVAEILPMVAIAPVPETPTWLLGVINLRGQALPVMDLRARLDMPTRESDLNTPIIVAEHGGRSLGLVVDAVVDVSAVSTDSMQSADDLVGATQTVGAVARDGERLILILDLQTLLTGTENLADRLPKVVGESGA